MIRYEYKNCLAEAVGPQHGLTGEELCKFAPKAARAVKKIFREKKKGIHDYLKLPSDEKLARQIRQFADSRKGQFRDIVVLGIGGSALGMTALDAALSRPFSKFSQPDRPRVFVLDNIDPEFISGAMQAIDWDRSCFVVISKSGSTAETMAQLLIVRDELSKRFGERHRERIIVITDAEIGPLRQIASEEKFDSFPVPAGVGGRFSVLSAVGLVPAALAGIEIEKLLAGAAQMEKQCQTDSFAQNPALQYASTHYLLHTKRKKSLFVNFSYSERLKFLSDWWKQLVAESLGKRLNVKGKEVFLGPTPCSAVGVTDQHSQVQLYSEGPFDKVFTLLQVERFASDIAIPSDFSQHDAASSLAGHKLGQLFEAERAGTEVALTQAKRPNGRIVFPEVTAETVGQYVLMMELAVSLMGNFYRINPYDQPGVEAGKIAARKFLAEAK